MLNKNIYFSLWILPLLMSAFSLSPAQAAPFPFPEFSSPIQYRYLTYFENKFLDDPSLSVTQKVINWESAKEMLMTVTPRKKGKARSLDVDIELTNYLGNRHTIKLGAADEGYLRWTRCEDILKSPQGEILRSEYYDATDASLAYPVDAYHPSFFPICFGVFVGMAESSHKFNVWGNHLTLGAMNIRKVREEKIKLPYGMVDSFLLRAEFDLSDYFGFMASFIVKRFVPELSFWMAKEPPYHMLKLRASPSQMPSLNSPFIIYYLPTPPRVLSP